MRIDILTLFPNMFIPLKEGIIGRAKDNNLIDINIINIRDFTESKHKKVDDTIFGGGAGMLMACQPLSDAILSVKKEDSKVIYLSPKGKILDQKKVEKMASDEKHIILICGHYEGIDERIIELYVDEEISIGDYVLTGGELPAMVLTDSIARLIDGVLHSEDSAVDDSISSGLLEYPQYTKPRNFLGLDVPEVLLSGDHKKIADWRKEKSISITKERRPDLYEKYISKNKK